MKSIASLLLAATCVVAEHPDPNDYQDLKFVFELVRHGARVNFVEPWISMFGDLGSGNLTPSGMRQRHLLGRYNRQRYTETYPLYSPDYIPGEVYMQSTNVLRTLQSGYS